jgi:hypothetical protein
VIILCGTLLSKKIICDLPINEPGQFDSSRAKPKNLFSYLKSTRSDNSGVAPLEKEDKLITETEEKANILNQPFQSCMKLMSCVSQERAFLKPCWRLYNILLFSRCDMMLLVIICSMQKVVTVVNKL